MYGWKSISLFNAEASSHGSSYPHGIVKGCELAETIIVLDLSRIFPGSSTTSQDLNPGPRHGRPRLRVCLEAKYHEESVEG